MTTEIRGRDDPGLSHDELFEEFMKRDYRTYDFYHMKVDCVIFETVMTLPYKGNKEHIYDVHLSVPFTSVNEKERPIIWGPNSQKELIVSDKIQFTYRGYGKYTPVRYVRDYDDY